MIETSLTMLWPEDHSEESSGVVANLEGPNTELAVILLASGCTLAYVRKQCGFESLRAVSAFASDSEVARAVSELTTLRAKRIGTRAMVRLERILSQEHSDLRATVLAVRTGLELSGQLKGAHSTPTRTVSELSVPELNELILSTRNELNARISSGGPLIEGKS